MRYLTGLACILSLGVMPLVGCTDGGVACAQNVCPCTEAGIRAAVEAGGEDPYTFDCEGPQTVVTEAEIVIDNDVVLDGEGNLTVDGNERHRVFRIPKGVTVELRGFALTQGMAGELEPGGGISNSGSLTLTNSTVSNSLAGRGGGVSNEGTLTLTRSTVSRNEACSEFLEWGVGGGIWNAGTLTVTSSTVARNGTCVGGGGIVNNASLTLVNSTVSDNRGSHGPGGIFNIGTMTLMNSTVAGNRAEIGGGISNIGTMTLMSSTVSGNTADFGGGMENSGTLTLTSTLVDGDCELWANPLDSITSLGYNIESPGDTCGFDTNKGDQINVGTEDLNLGPLADNDGPTLTHKPGDGGFDTGSSAAIDKIPEANCQVTEDQRGEPRPETGGTMCDVGSVEVQP